ncbi:NFATC2-interacting protein isoform X2 [Elgaria multicarinata webbii]|uniref:NFATC2-interacting protein isoform X2 n=1 Tax=Elgaria multicarinata webbii TaxID=159646 RepID=UPI002FCD6993
MAETVDSCPSSDSEPEGTSKKPLRKRRRLFTDTAVPAVPVYSAKVQNSLQLFPDSLKLPVQIPELSPKSQDLGASDEEEEAPSKHVEQEIRCQDLSPSPPPPPRPRKRRRAAHIFDQQLRNLTSTLSAAKKSLQDEGSGDDVIVIDAPEPSESPELVLKIRCRADLYRVSIRMTDPLQRVAEHMGQTLKVHPNRILLLLRDRELAADATPAGLGLGVADIIDCIVEATSRESADVGNLRLRVQGKDKSSEMEIMVQKGEPLQALMNRYRQAQGLGRRKLVFHFDGQRLMETWTPEALGMESGDVIEVWS